MTDKPKEEARTVQIFNKGIRTYNLAGKRSLLPGSSLLVTEKEAVKLSGYSDVARLDRPGVTPPVEPSPAHAPEPAKAPAAKESRKPKA